VNITTFLSQRRLLGRVVEAEVAHLRAHGELGRAFWRELGTELSRVLAQADMVEVEFELHLRRDVQRAADGDGVVRLRQSRLEQDAESA
jgi:hypothetical protein